MNSYQLAFYQNACGDQENKQCDGQKYYFKSKGEKSREETNDR